MTPEDRMADGDAVPQRSMMITGRRAMVRMIVARPGEKTFLQRRLEALRVRYRANGGEWATAQPCQDQS